MFRNGPSRIAPVRCHALPTGESSKPYNCAFCALPPSISTEEPRDCGLARTAERNFPLKPINSSAIIDVAWARCLSASSSLVRTCRHHGTPQFDAKGSGTWTIGIFTRSACSSGQFGLKWLTVPSLSKTDFFQTIGLEKEANCGDVISVVPHFIAAWGRGRRSDVQTL